MRIHVGILGTVLLAVVGACSQQLPDAGEPPEVTIPPTDDAGLEAWCGSVRMAGGASPILPSVPADAAALEAIATIETVAPGEADFFDGYEWFVAERTEGRLILFGRSLGDVVAGQPPYASAAFTETADGFRPQGWGQCRIAVAAPGLGNAHWVLDEEPDAGNSQLALLINETSCASGQPPVGREIMPVVITDLDRVTIIVLVEPVRGDANCPSNPWHPITVDLPEPLGDRPLFDGSEVPALLRPWPPTQTSLDSMGYQE